MSNLLILSPKKQKLLLHILVEYKLNIRHQVIRIVKEITAPVIIFLILPINIEAQRNTIGTIYLFLINTVPEYFSLIKRSKLDVKMIQMCNSSNESNRIKLLLRTVNHTGLNAATFFAISMTFVFA